MSREPRPAPPFRFWYLALVMFASTFLSMGLLFAYVHYIGENGQADTCAVITAQRGVYDETPPSTTAGRKAKLAWDHLAQTLGCD